MKLVVIGFGKCGNRIADAFARLNKRALNQRGIEVITDVFAVDTDTTDLGSLCAIKPDYQHRILIGGQKTDGHGVAQLSELGAGIIEENSDKVVDAIRMTRRFFETDAFLLTAGTAGGTGSGGIPIMAQRIKDCYGDKPVYALVVLPFEDEEETEERTVYNTAVCLKSVYSVVDALFLVDNQRYARKDPVLRDNLTKINESIVKPFYDLLCAGEEKKTKYIGVRMADAGEIIQTLTGWTAIGNGELQLPLVKLPFRLLNNFRNKSIEMHVWIQAIEEAIGQLSLSCNPADAGRALYLVSAPASEVKIDLLKELGNYLKGITREATISSCDYPRGKGVLSVTIILSELSSVEKVKAYYNRVANLMQEIRVRQAEAEDKVRAMKRASKKIPSLL